MNNRELVLGALQGRHGERIPAGCVNPTVTLAQMEQLGVFWPEAHYDAEKMAMLAAGAHTILGFDTVRVPFCQTVEAEALGCGLKDGGSSSVPFVVTHPVTKLGDPFVVPTDLLGRGRIPVVLDAIGRLHAQMNGDALVMGGVVGPFTLTGYLIGMDVLLIEGMANPNTIKPYMEIAVEAARAFATDMIRAGADAICVEDMAASIDVIEPETYRELVLPFQKKLFESIGAPTVLHICGDVSPVLADMAESGADALSIEAKVDVGDARRAVGARVALIGTIDPVGVLLHGTPRDVREASHQALEAGVDLLAPGCAIPPGTRTENIVAMVASAREY